jgi:hypothetical protein
MFELQPPRSTDLNSLDVYLWGHLKILVYPAQMEYEVALHQYIYYACQAICNCPPGPLK